MRLFAGIELGDGRIPDATIILNFRHPLEKHVLMLEKYVLTETPFAEVNTHLSDKSITLRSGALIDGTIIDATISTKNKAGAGGPQDAVNQEA